MARQRRRLAKSDAELAFVLGGGGARAAYQVGILRHIAAKYPDLAPGILAGVSAGGIIATHLASRPGTLAESVEHLSELWLGLRIEKVFKVGPLGLSSRVGQWGTKLLSGGAPTPRVRSLVDTAPLRQFLEGALQPAGDGGLPNIARNLRAHRLDSVALTSSSYTTGQSTTWVETREGCGVLAHDGTLEAAAGGLRIDHVMASSALPFFFPAVNVDGAWYGDGGIRLTAPLSPAIHLGARRIIAVSTRYGRAGKQTPPPPAVDSYPPPAQVAGVLLNAIFLDLLDADAVRLEQLNRLIERLPEDQRDGLQPIDLLVLRPSRDLGKLANEFEAELPRAFRFLLRGLGIKETRSNDLLSLVMFQPDYIARMVELGEADAHARRAEIDAFLQAPPKA